MKTKVDEGIPYHNINKNEVHEMKSFYYVRLSSAGAPNTSQAATVSSPTTTAGSATPTTCPTMTIFLKRMTLTITSFTTR